jgi:hypothetical protein
MCWCDAPRNASPSHIQCVFIVLLAIRMHGCIANACLCLWLLLLLRLPKPSATLHLIGIYNAERLREIQEDDVEDLCLALPFAAAKVPAPLVAPLLHRSRVSHSAGRCSPPAPPPPCFGCLTVVGGRGGKGGRGRRRRGGSAIVH